MDFLNGIGAKLTQTGQKAQKTANDFMATTKLNGQINELNKAVQELYGKLGEQYFGLHGDTPDEALAELCGQIKAKQEEIAAARAELEKIKSEPTCPSCGAAVAPGTKFCTKCGTKLEQN